MNKILIVCDGKEIVIETKFDASTIKDFISDREDKNFIEISKNQFIAPHAVTMVKDITLELEEFERKLTKKRGAMDMV